MRCCKLLLILTFSTLPIFAELSISRMEKMVEDIKAKRVSKIKDKSLVDSPFIIIKSDSNTSVKISIPVAEGKNTFSLGAIMNSSAYIDGSWHKQGGKIGDFTIDDITDDHVVLKKENRTITLFFRKTEKILNIKEQK